MTDLEVVHNAAQLRLSNPDGIKVVRLFSIGRSELAYLVKLRPELRVMVVGDSMQSLNEHVGDIPVAFMEVTDQSAKDESLITEVHSKLMQVSDSWLR